MPTARVSQKTVRQSASCWVTPPINGVSPGTRAKAMVMAAMVRASSTPSKLSRVAARETTSAAAAPAACTARAHSSVDKLSATAQARVPARNRARPANSTGRRPNRSASGPYTSCATAKASRKTARVSCAAPASTPRAAAMKGRAGV